MTGGYPCCCPPPTPPCTNCDGDTIDLELVVSGTTLASGCADDDSAEFDGTWALTLNRSSGCCYWLSYITSGSQNSKPARKSNTSGALISPDTKSAVCTVATPTINEAGNVNPGLLVTPFWCLQIGTECFLPSPSGIGAITSATVRLTLYHVGSYQTLFNTYQVHWWTIWEALATGTPDVPCDLSLDLPMTLSHALTKETINRLSPLSGVLQSSSTADYNWPSTVTLQAA